MLICNAAVDEKLATSIFNTIYPPSPLPRIYTRKLALSVAARLYTDDDRNVNVDNYVENRITTWLGRSWVLKQCATSPIECVMTVGGRNAHCYLGSPGPCMKIAFPRDGEKYEKIWKSIWPEARTGDWRLDWESLPLWSEATYK